MFELIFWLSSFKELMVHGSSLSGWFVLIAQVIHLGIMADFFYFYVKSITMGAPMELPTTYAGGVV